MEIDNYAENAIVKHYVKFFDNMYHTEYIREMLYNGSKEEWIRMCERHIASSEQGVGISPLKKLKSLRSIMRLVEPSYITRSRDVSLAWCEKSIALYDLWYPRTMRSMGLPIWYTLIDVLDALFDMREELLSVFHLQPEQDDSVVEPLRSRMLHLTRDITRNIETTVFIRRMDDLIRFIQTVTKYLPTVYVRNETLSNFRALQQREVGQRTEYRKLQVLNFVKVIDMRILQLINAFIEDCLVKLRERQTR